MTSGHSGSQLMGMPKNIWRLSAITLAIGLGFVFLILIADFPVENSRVLYLLFYIVCWILALCCVVNFATMVVFSIVGIRSKKISIFDLVIVWFVSICLDVFGGFFVVIMLLGMSGYGQ